MGGKAYTTFASIYDDIMGAVPYKFWYDYLHEIMDYYNLKPKKILDLACGTGNMSLLFAQNGYEVTGVDLSSQMLREARKKAEERGVNIKFMESDMREFQTSEKYDMVYSVFDSLNYILEQEDLKKVFQNVYNVLTGEGFFMFDMNTMNRLMSIHQGTTVLNGDGYSCVWEDIVDKEEKLWKVKLKIYLKESGEYFEELHQETGYQIDVLKGLLYEIGFEYVEVYNAYTFNKAKDDDNRIYFIAFADKSTVEKKTSLIKSVKNVKWGFKRLFEST